MRLAVRALGLVIVLALLPCAFSLAEEGQPKQDGNRFLSRCGPTVTWAEDPSKPFDAWDFGWCMGFVYGLTNANSFYEGVLGPRAFFCEPAGVTHGQEIRVVIGYLKSHPESLHENDGALAFRAFREAWPCPQNPKAKSP